MDQTLEKDIKSQEMESTVETLVMWGVNIYLHYWFEIIVQFLVYNEFYKLVVSMISYSLSLI